MYVIAYSGLLFIGICVHLHNFKEKMMMEIYTSYFGKLRKLQDNGILPVSIAIGTPRWFFGGTYPSLAPRRGMLKMNEDAYRREFDKILSINPPMKVLRDLDVMARNNGKRGVALLCYETPEKFCHRHLVAEWFKNKLGIEVKEYDYVPKIETAVPEQLNLFGGE